MHHWLIKVLLKGLYSCFLLCFTSWWCTATPPAWFSCCNLSSASVKVSSFFKQKRRINEDGNDLHSTCALRSPQALLGGQNILTGKVQNKNLITLVCFFDCLQGSPIIFGVFWINSSFSLPRTFVSSHQHEFKDRHMILCLEMPQEQMTPCSGASFWPDLAPFAFPFLPQPLLRETPPAEEPLSSDPVCCTAGPQGKKCIYVIKNCSAMVSGKLLSGCLAQPITCLESIQPS